MDIGSSAVANGVLGLVFGVLTSLVVDMAFLIQVTQFAFFSTDIIHVIQLFFFLMENCLHSFMHREFNTSLHVNLNIPI